MLALAEDDYTQAVHGYFRTLPRPRAVVVLSAHNRSQSDVVEISAAKQPGIDYDFSGFPNELYQLEYNCPGSPEVAIEVAARAGAAGFKTELNTTHRMDHGVWIPLKVAYPEANVPVVQISMPYGNNASAVLKLGQALAPLREQGVLILGTGGAVHNLSKLKWSEKDTGKAPWAEEFESWLMGCLARKDVQSLVNYRDVAPNAELAHPTPEHFYPILFTVGAALSGDRALGIYEGIQYYSLSMFSFALTA